MNDIDVTIKLDYRIVEKAVTDGWKLAFNDLSSYTDKGFGVKWIESKLQEYIRTESFNAQLNSTITAVASEKLLDTASKVVDDVLRGALKKRLQDLLRNPDLLKEMAVKHERES